MSRNFNTWLSGFRDSISDYAYYVNFEKVYRNVDAIKIELNIENIDTIKFEDILEDAKNKRLG